MKFAICNDIPEFGGNRLADPAWAKRFPGTGWIVVFTRLAAEHGWEVTSGDIALSHVQCGYWKAADVFVIQELNSAWGARLREAGCRPLLLTCLESPLYASLFYDRWDKLAAIFPHYMLPTTAIAREEVVESARGWPLRFPCYWQERRIKTIDWEVRSGDVVLVAANKYWNHRDRSAVPPLTRPRAFLHWCNQAYKLKRSSSLRLAQRQQLHDTRLEAILALSSANMLSIYGSGWDQLSVLPSAWQQRLAKIQLPYYGKVDDKHHLQSEFRFALCFENIASPGYVTEKIIEALVAGALPVYLGAPDIADYVPSEAFIDAGQLSSMAELPEMLKAISAGEAVEKIKAGRRFLDSAAGCLHSYEGFAKWVERLVQEQLNAIRRE